MTGGRTNTKEPWQCRICTEAMHVNEYNDEDAPGGLCWNCLVDSLTDVPKPEGIPELIAIVSRIKKELFDEPWDDSESMKKGMELEHPLEDALRACGIES